MTGTGPGGDDRQAADSYLAAVREALDDLPPTDREDLVEDLPGHLLETAADAGLPLERTLGTAQAYAAELRASAGLPPRGAVQGPGSRRATPRRRLRDSLVTFAASVADLVHARGRRLSAVVAELPYGRSVLAFLPELRPGWWVLRGYLAVALLAAFGIFFSIGLAPFLTLFGSDLLGLLAVVVAIVVSVRLGRRSSAMPLRRRQLLATGNVALVALCVLGGLALRDRLGYSDDVVYASAQAGYLTGPQGGISNLYAFDASGRPLRDVQLFDQDGRPLDTLLLAAPDGSYAEPVRARDEYGAEVLNVFPRTLVTETWGPTGQPTTVPVPPPVISPRRLATASPSAAPSPSASATPSASLSAVPTPTTAPAMPLPSVPVPSVPAPSPS